MFQTIRRGPAILGVAAALFLPVAGAAYAAPGSALLPVPGHATADPGKGSHDPDKAAGQGPSKTGKPAKPAKQGKQGKTAKQGKTGGQGQGKTSKPVKQGKPAGNGHEKTGGHGHQSHDQGKPAHHHSGHHHNGAHHQNAHHNGGHHNGGHHQSGVQHTGCENGHHGGREQGQYGERRQPQVQPAQPNQQILPAQPNQQIQPAQPDRQAEQRQQLQDQYAQYGRILPAYEQQRERGHGHTPDHGRTDCGGKGHGYGHAKDQGGYVKDQGGHAKDQGGHAEGQGQGGQQAKGQGMTDGNDAKDAKSTVKQQRYAGLVGQLLGMTR